MHLTFKHTSNPMKLLSSVTLQRSQTFSFLWMVQYLPSDQQQLNGTSCDPIKACHRRIIDYSLDYVLVIWCHRLLLRSTLQQHRQICNIKYHLRVEMWEHAMLRDSLLLLDMSSMDLLQYNLCQFFPRGLLFSLWAMHCVHSMILHSIRVSLFRIILAISPTDEVQSLDGPVDVCFFLYLCCSHPFNTTDMLNIHSSIFH